MDKVQSANPVLSIIIPVYKADQDFFQLLSVLARQKINFSFEILIIDDCSPDNTVERIHQHLKQLSLPFIKLLTLKQNVGPAGARNFAISHARGKVFWLVDADCNVLSDNFLSQVYQAYLQHPNSIIGGGVNGYGKGLVAFIDRYCHWATNIPSQPSGPVKSGHLVTANMIIPRAVFEKIGPLDSSLRTGEDTSFCFKARQSNIELRFEGNLRLNHHDRENYKDFLRTFYTVGQDRAFSRYSAYGSAPWYLAGPKILRWLLIPSIACALTIKNFFKWWPYDKRVIVALPGIFIGMLAMAIGVAVGRNEVKPTNEMLIIAKKDVNK